MKTPSPLRSLRVGTVIAATAFLSPGILSAATVVWDGTDGEYLTAAKWGGGSVPNTNNGDTAHITAGAVTYTPGGDLPLHSGGTLRVSGGSWTQVVGNAWIQMAGGTILVDGGVFNQGTAGNIVLDATSAITVTAGTANLNGNYIYQASSGSLNISGTGVVNIANEFKPIDTYTMSGGKLTANLISFADGPGSINFSGGLISLNGAGGNSGFYGGGVKSLNFTAGSTGSLFFSSYTTTELSSDGFLTNGTIRFNGTVDSGQFTLTSADGGVYVTLTAAAVPEPSTFAALAGTVILGFTVLRRRRIG
ncbi:MAG: PEP-CTERM sorting domain-containing protein [Rariglobus sp.]|nr:PEP-CTERM sorting domain-containing protein [Rariglobus sp.]